MILILILILILIMSMIIILIIYVHCTLKPPTVFLHINFNLIYRYTMQYCLNCLVFFHLMYPFIPKYNFHKIYMEPKYICWIVTAVRNCHPAKNYAHTIESNTCYELTTTHVTLTTTRVTTTHVTCYPQTEDCTSKLQGRRSKSVQNELKLEFADSLEKVIRQSVEGAAKGIDAFNGFISSIVFIAFFSFTRRPLSRISFIGADSLLCAFWINCKV